MDNLISGNKDFSEIMKKSMLSITNENFEDHLMQKIEAENQAMNSIRKNKRISIGFFIAGLFLGLIINFSLSDFANSLLGNIGGQEFSLYFQIGLVVFILIYLDKLYRPGILKFRRKNF